MTENKIIFCTVITASFLPYARVLMRSLAPYFPADQLHVLIADCDENTDIKQEDGVTLHKWTVLGLPGFARRAFVNSPGGLCCSLKPGFLAWTLRKTNAAAAVYADADSRFYRSPDELIRQALGAPFVLTPHRITPSVQDPLRNDGMLARAGTYNAGLFAVQNCETGLAILDWWSDGMWSDVWQNQEFAWDQIWTPMIQHFWPDTQVCRDPNVNVAYWNVSEREVTKNSSNNCEVAGMALTHFHFSFFDPEQTDQLVSHDNEILPHPSECVHELAIDYAKKLTDADQDRASLKPYGFGKFHDGTGISHRHRDYFRIRALQTSTDDDDPFDPHFAPPGGGYFERVSKAANPLARFIRRLKAWV